ncbi:MAG: SLC13 family permease [Pseudomonadales bacterium]|nr:SLC13 family permease [Pseudomonadales bacterium]
MTTKSVFHLISAVSTGIILYSTVDAESSVRMGLAIFSTVAWLWISEAIAISVTALLIPVLAILAGIFSSKEAFSQFANPIIFIFMGGFALAAALEKHHLDRALAGKILSLSGGRPLLSILLLFLITALLSMWISNTATVAMMLPLALGLLSDHDPRREASLYTFVLLGLAYSGNIGGMATLIGSPPNAIAAAAAGLTFRDWLSWGIPFFLILFPIMVALLYFLLRPTFEQQLVLNHTPLNINRQHIGVIIIFACTALGWVSSSHLSELLGINRGLDAVIAVLAIVFLVGSGSLKFEEFTAKTNWGILILFGGGLTLSALLQSTGASAWLAELISSHLPDNNHWLVLIIICLFVIFLTELVSNTASAALLIPLFISIAKDLDLSTTGIAVVIALCASCAFMLPVATPPNALVFSTGHITQKKMMHTGLVLNLCLALVIASIAWVVID